MPDQRLASTHTFSRKRLNFKGPPELLTRRISASVGLSHWNCSERRQMGFMPDASRSEGTENMVMRAIAEMVCAGVVWSFLSMAAAPAQPMTQQPKIQGCSSERTAIAAQTVRCGGGVTIVAEDGAQFTLHDRDRNGDVDSVDLRSKALLLDAPTQHAGHRFEVTTPQAIAAVRGTKWAVDAQAATTSVLVLRGQVTVRRRAAKGRVVLGPGEGVDVDPGAGPLTVKRWPEARVAALLARLGQ
jgi:ferric-dicitrate binding protein FerR (iron transport regulator)